MINFIVLILLVYKLDGWSGLDSMLRCSLARRN